MRMLVHIKFLLLLMTTTLINRKGTVCAFKTQPYQALDISRNQIESGFRKIAYVFGFTNYQQ